MTIQEKADFEKVNLVQETLNIMDINMEKIMDRGGKFNDLEHGLRMPGKAFFPTCLKCFGQLCRLTKYIVGCFRYSLSLSLHLDFALISH
jgi:hypothetical protein